MNESYNLLQKHFDTAFDTPDGIKKLRELILTLAMRGKLVPQDPNDQPASELLKEIAAEKARLIKAGKLKPQKPLPPINPEETPCQIPSNWQWVRLIDIAQYNGRPNARPEDLSSETWVLDLEDIEKETSVILRRATYAERQSKSSKSLFCKGDVLYGKLRPYLNKVIVAEEDGVCTTEIVPVVPFSGVFPVFLKFLLKRPSFLSYVNSLSYGVKMPRLGSDDAMASIHPLPPIAEQKRIVARIEQLMGRCDELERLRAERDRMRLDTHAAAINQLLSASDSENFSSAWRFITSNFAELYSVKENVAELRKTILQLAVMGKLVPQNPNDQPASELLKEIAAEKARLIKSGKLKPQKPLPPIKPEERAFHLPVFWEWTRLGDCVSVLGDGIHGTPKFDDAGEFFFINGNNLSDGIIEIKRETKRVAEEEYSKYRKELNDRTVLVSINGTIGNIAFYDNEKVVLGKSACYFNLFPQLDKIYIKKIINGQYFVRYAIEAATGSTIKNVSLGAMRHFPLPLPPLAEQKRIVARVDQLMALCDNLEKSIAAAGDGRTALLNAMMAKV